MKTASRMQAGAALLALTCLTPLAANAQTTLRIQTPHAESSPTGELIAQFVDDIETMSGGDIDIEMYYSNALVDTGERLLVLLNSGNLATTQSVISLLRQRLLPGRPYVFHRPQRA